LRELWLLHQVGVVLDDHSGHAFTRTLEALDVPR
jgi:hypothetical protein